jgi:hypothetical protein
MSTGAIPSLQGTLAKRTKLTRQPNFAKEPFHPSHFNAGLRDFAYMIDKQFQIKNRQCLTPHIAHCRVGCVREFVLLFLVTCTWRN